MAAMSQADAVWEGDLMGGRGRVKVASGTFGEFPVTWAQRADRTQSGTSPEELLAAAHAACVCMAFSNGLSKAGHKPERLNGTAEVEFVPGKGIAWPRQGRDSGTSRTPPTASSHSSLIPGGTIWTTSVGVGPSSMDWSG